MKQFAQTWKKRGMATFLSAVIVAAFGLFLAGCSPAAVGGGVPPAAPAAPAAPLGVSATPGTAQVSIAWSAASGATSYNLYWADTTGVTKATGTKITGVSSPYLHTLLANGTTYFYIVTAVGAGGESSASAQVSATPATNPPPGNPASLAAVAKSTTSVQLTWPAVTGASGYNVYRSTTSGTGTGGSKIASGGGITSPYTDSTASLGQTYYYVVTATNANGESTASPEASATPAPFITGQVVNMPDGTAVHEEVDIYTDAGMTTGITGATVMLNTSAMIDGSSDGRYQTSSANIVPGAAISVTINGLAGGLSYTMTFTQFTAPTVSSPTNLTSWDSTISNSINWSGGSGSNSYGKSYYVGVTDFASWYYGEAHGPYELATSTTTASVPSSSWATVSPIPTTSPLNVVVGIGTPGINSTGGVPVSNALSGSAIGVADIVLVQTNLH